MQQDWMIDVLTDLQKFALQNQMGRLSKHLEEVIHTAAAELAAKECEVTLREQNDTAQAGVHRSYRPC